MYRKTIDAYLKKAKWIGDSDPMAVGLQLAADSLDEKFTVSIWAEANKTIKYIESLNPAAGESTAKVDPLIRPATGLEKRGA